MSQYDNENWVRAMVDNGITEETAINVATEVITKRLEMQMQQNLHRQIKDITKVIERKHDLDGFHKTTSKAAQFPAR